MRALRNIAIIMLLALIVAAVPGGGNAAQGFFAIVTLAFLAVIGFVGYYLYRQNRLAYLTLDERQRAILLGGAGAIVLALAGAEELTETGTGLVVFVAILAVSAFGIARVVMDARSL